jgi:hypothetical protein
MFREELLHDSVPEEIFPRQSVLMHLDRSVRLLKFFL